ncbi:ShlB/FhaC/HecB family hemolysin secretion/activation protein [Oxalobacteraceae bacterium CAVE-383]|nr:ShlB/FhaC/HecB family hemolysin secretion/activation protein [Oxalobacteraceae bacterium CAVE-383]
MKRLAFSCSLLAGALRASALVALAIPCIVHAQQPEETVQQDETFKIDHFEVDGNTLLPKAEVERLVAPMAGPHQVYGDIQKALEALEDAYRKAGFTTVGVYVPEQELTSGVVHITITENVLGHIEIAGNKYFDDANVMNGLRPLRIGEAPNLREISAAIQLGNDNAAKQVAVSLAASEIPGQIDAKVNVTDSNPRRIFATVDNTGTKATGKWRTGIAWQENNLFNKDHVATLAYTTSPDSPSGVSVNLYSLGYRIPFYKYGDSLDFVYGKSSVNTPNSSPTLGQALGIIGKGDVGGLRWNHFLPRVGERTGKIVFGIDYKHIDSSCTLDGVPIEDLGACTPYTTRPLSITYIGQIAGAGQQIDYNIGLSRNWATGAKHQNKDISGNPTENDRYSFLTPGNRTSQDDFTILRGGASIFKGFANDWQMRLAGTMQYSPYAVVSSEQLGLVGSTAVRGFDERVMSADSGLVANAELYTPELAARLGIPGTLRLLSFYDYGAGFNSHLGGGTTPSNINVASVGVGARLSAGKDFNVRADVARVTIPGRTSTIDPPTVRRGDWRAHISAVLGF